MSEPLENLEAQLESEYFENPLKLKITEKYNF